VGGKKIGEEREELSHSHQKESYCPASEVLPKRGVGTWRGGEVRMLKRKTHKRWLRRATKEKGINKRRKVKSQSKIRSLDPVM